MTVLPLALVQLEHMPFRIAALIKLPSDSLRSIVIQFKHDISTICISIIFFLYRLKNNTDAKVAYDRTVLQKV